MSRIVLPESMAVSVWAVLVKHCGAPATAEDVRDFVLVASVAGISEHRFQGSLGFGGKVCVTRDRIYVSCYPEDATPARKKAIERANEELLKVPPLPAVG